MSTSETSTYRLTIEANTIARKLKGMTWPGGSGTFKFGIVQDDKIITVTMTAAKIEETTEDALTQMLLSYMQGATPQ